ncbi:excalibur domain-containing protein [Mycobacteroides abscessus subsp. abscessus]|nr:excalibur domain-containing protein [Mycobacteroides abscessus subsp. abscessus]
MIRILSNCAAPEADSPQPAPAPTAPPQAGPSQTAPSSTTYANCTQARAAGAAPLYRGQPGYSAKLDRDGDGVACE